MLGWERFDQFQSTPPAWGATVTAQIPDDPDLVSIHAPRVGGDGTWRNKLHALEISCHNCGPAMPCTYRKKVVNPKLEHLFECTPVRSSADVPANPCSLGVRVRDALHLQAKRSQNEGAFRIVSHLGADVLDPSLPFRSEEVEAKAVLCGIGFREETRPQHNPLSRIHETLED